MEREEAFVAANFYDGLEFLNDDWKRTFQIHRHKVTIMSAHGFNFKICCNKSYHEPTEECVYVMCIDRRSIPCQGLCQT